MHVNIVTYRQEFWLCTY